jgi:hypothetical protein
LLSNKYMIQSACVSNWETNLSLFIT